MFLAAFLLFLLTANRLTVSGVTEAMSVNPTSLASAPLIQQSDLIYQGAFRVPAGLSNQQTLAYGGMGMAYNPARNSLFMVGHVWYQQTAEVTIPAIKNSNNVADLATAAFLQWGDVTDGNLGAHGGRIYGELVYGSQLYGAVYSAVQPTSHFRSGLDLSVNADFRGFYRVGSLDQRFASGYMTEIPTEWKSALGGPVLTGGCCNPGDNGATSLGPAAFVVNPIDLGQQNPVPTIPLVYYSQSHPTLGVWNNTTVVNRYYNMMSEVTGVAFPPGTRSVLFFGRTGIGIPCYGNGTNDPAMDRQPWSGGGSGAVYCYDPNEVDGGFGPHAYPYAYQVWAYDALDFLAVKNGQQNPWDVRPYAIWNFDLPFQDSHRHIQAATFDATTGRIFVSQFGGETNGVPIIHVFTVSAGTPPSAPSAPLNLRIVQ